MRGFSAPIACAVACVFANAASAAPYSSSSASRPAPVAAAGISAKRSIPAPASTIRRTGRRLSLAQSQAAQEANRAVAERVLTIASALPKVRALRAEHPRSVPFLTVLGNGDRVVLYEQPNGALPSKEVGRVRINPRTGQVLEQLTTPLQLEWQLARGEPGRYGGHANALYVWLPLCLLFMLPFVNFRRPLSLLHLDLLVLLSFSVSLAAFNHAHIYASVPLVYPPLIYLLARMLALVRRSGAHREPGPLRLHVPVPWLAVGIVLLIGFRIGLNVSDSTVIDVGRDSVLGAQKLADGKPFYDSLRLAHEQRDSYGPVIYEAYVPFEQVFGRNTSHNLAATHGAAIVFDLLAVAVLFLLGRRVRGPTLGIALAYAWVTFPFTLLALENNSNDALLVVLITAALLAASYTSKLAGTMRGVFAALAGLTKFVPLAMAPLLATHGLRELSPARRPYALALFLLGFLLTAALVFVPVLGHNSLHTIYERTIAFQASRETPFSVWGLYGGLGGLQLVVKIAAVALALALAVVPRRADIVGLSAGCAAVIVATQLGAGYWFYFYMLWFFPLAMLAVLGRFGAPVGPRGSSAPARAGQPALPA